MKEKKKNYRLRSKMYKGLGTTTMISSAIGGVSIYEFLIKPSDQVGQDFVAGAEMFIENVWVESSTGKLNVILALPFLIGLIIALLVTMKKNKDYFKDKMSLSLFVTIAILYLIYSLIGYALSSLIGVWVGVIADEFIFSPMSMSARKHYEFDDEVEKEKRKEKARIKARREAERELNASV